MSRYKLLAVTVSVILGSALGLQAKPTLEVDPPVFDFGRKAVNDKVYDFTFTLRNKGDEPLRIEDVKPGCGCTKVAVAKKELAPNESTELKGQLKTDHFEGVNSKTITVTSNDPKHRITMLELRIRLPYDDVGPRLTPKGGTFFVIPHPNKQLYVYPWVENCDAKAPVVIKKVDIPEGWKCTTKLPVTVAPEQKTKLTFSRSYDGEMPELKGLSFTVYTDYTADPAKSELKGKISLPRRGNMEPRKTTLNLGPKTGRGAEAAPAKAAPAAPVTPAPEAKVGDAPVPPLPPAPVPASPAPAPAAGQPAAAPAAPAP